jgi:hypothetical protein
MNRTPVFSLSDPLPQGSTVLEASAGTGKTFTIAALTARFIAEGHARLDEMLLVTFGRMATQELRERIRDQLIRAETGLADPGRAGDDPVVTLLAGEQAGLRRSRLAAALSGFDEAMIATTHTFCHRMLVGLGISGDVDPHAELTEDIADLVAQVSTDQYLRRAAHARTHLTLETALQIGRQIPGLAGSRLFPVGEPSDSEDGQRLELAHAIDAALAWRKRHDRVLDFDDLQGLLRDALTHPVRGERVAELLRRRFKVVLVDESHRRPQTGDLRVSWCRRLHLSGSRRPGAPAGHPQRQLPLRPGAAGRPRRVDRRSGPRRRTNHGESSRSLAQGISDSRGSTCGAAAGLRPGRLLAGATPADGRGSDAVADRRRRGRPGRRLPRHGAAGRPRRRSGRAAASQ